MKKNKSRKPVLHFRTVVLSDVHLGAPDCQIDKVNHFLKHVDCENLLLNGDIIDGWSLGRRGGWERKHTRFIRLVLKKIDKRKTKVIYLRGNHDDILDRFLPLRFGGLKVVDRYIHDSPKGRYLVIHGDAFDAVTQNSKLIAILGDIGYQSLLRINRVYNRYRSWRGKPYFSLSKAIKAHTKTVVNYISRFEGQVEAMTRKHGCQGFICGHIHTPENKRIGSVHYLNSGDWIESNTALVEHADGTFEVLEYEAFCRRLEEERRRQAKPVIEPLPDPVEAKVNPLVSA
ncbi:MAG: UDP-2,3-diacylglucosamine diphosphatase [Verrucomicrobia bacterium]|jgi:UDP-2,3-diacylglucosamine pyrophosphatase LpxH|nr:UDP-2,3-diacylglucosamine diphosphatase [Verrucomicrobiota bacterium]